MILLRLRCLRGRAINGANIEETIVRRISNIFVTLIAAATMLAGCATSPTGRSQLLLISPESAIVESRKAYISTVQQLDSENKLLDDQALADRVQLITGRLVTIAVQDFPHTRDWDWSVALIDGPDTVNAWCMAGGRMAVYSGLFEKLKRLQARPWRRSSRSSCPTVGRQSPRPTRSASGSLPRRAMIRPRP